MYSTVKSWWKSILQKLKIGTYQASGSAWKGSYCHLYLDPEISFCQKSQPLSWPLPTLQWNVHGNLQIIYFRSHTTTIWSFISASIIRSLLKKWINQLKLGRFILGLLANSKLYFYHLFSRNPAQCLYWLPLDAIPRLRYSKLCRQRWNTNLLWQPEWFNPQTPVFVLKNILNENLSDWCGGLFRLMWAIKRAV